MTPGIHLIHKPVGPTSFAVVKSFMDAMPARPGRRALRVCHGGVLDPFASGLLLILVEPATRLFDYLHNVPKVYEGVVRWGAETDSGDLLGKVIREADPSALSPDNLDAMLARSVGWRDQVPPATSNKRVDGERAYVRVRRGEAVDLPPSRVYLHEARWLSHDLPRESRLRVVVAGGYYVRSLVRDLGRLLGCGAHLAGLHRRSIGPWSDPGQGRSLIITGRNVLPWTPVRELSDSDVGILKRDGTINVQPLTPAEWPMPAEFRPPHEPVRGMHMGRFSFLLMAEGDQLRPVASMRGL